MKPEIAPEQRGEMDQGWHLDRRVPLGLMLALLLQAATFIWWLASLSTTVSDHDRRLGKIEITGERQMDLLNQINVKLARIEERLFGSETRR